LKYLLALLCLVKFQTRAKEQEILVNSLNCCLTIAQI